jgi:hypothetical protein
MAPLEHFDRLEWVIHVQPLPGAERRLNDPDRPFTPGWLQYAIQRPLGRIASTPAVGHEQKVGVFGQFARKWP